MVRLNRRLPHTVRADASSRDGFDVRSTTLDTNWISPSCEGKYTHRESDNVSHKMLSKNV